MKQIIRNSYCGALLTCALLGLTATNASCQTIVRRSSFSPPAPPSLRYGRYLPSPFTNPIPPTPNMYPGYGPTAGQANTSGAPLTTGTTVQSPQNLSTSNPVTALRTADNGLLVQWSGDTRQVRQLSFGLFDSTGKMLVREDVMQMPAEALLTLTDGATFYGVQIQYLNGTTRTSYSPIR